MCTTFDCVKKMIGVAVGVAVGEVDGADVFAVDVDRGAVVERDHRQRVFRRGRRRAAEDLRAGGQALADVFVRDDRRRRGRRSAFPPV